MNSQDAELTAIVDEAEFCDYPLLWLITLAGPFLLTIAVLFIVWEFAGRNAMGRLVSTAVATFFFFGKFVILGGSEETIPLGMSLAQHIRCDCHWKRAGMRPDVLWQ